MYVKDTGRCDIDEDRADHLQAGPEFISMVAGETQSPRRVLPKAFNSTIYRVVFFYMGSALCVAINTPYNDPALLGAIAAGAPGAARSPVSQAWRNTKAYSLTVL